MTKKKKEKGYYEKTLYINDEKYLVTIRCKEDDFVTVRFYIHPYKRFPWYLREVYYDCDFLIRPDGSKSSLKSVVIRMASEFIDSVSIGAEDTEHEDFEDWDGIIEVSNNEDTNNNSNGR